MTLNSKLNSLKDRLKSLGSVLIAFSGGVDSSFLLKIATDVLGDNVLAVTAVSETYSKRELEIAREVAAKIGARHKIIRTDEFKDINFRSNPENRCYYCKKELFSRLCLMALRHKLAVVADGSNIGDISDYRPGTRAKKEFGVVSPLQDAGFTKKDIRLLSKKMRLSTWNKPALACLASRIPYNSQITKKRLSRIDKAEEALRKGFAIKGNLRVRDFEDEARIEVDKKEISLLKNQEKIKTLLSKFGYNKVVVDSDGYKCGSLNNALKNRQLSIIKIQ